MTRTTTMGATLLLFLVALSASMPAAAQAPPERLVAEFAGGVGGGIGGGGLGLALGTAGMLALNDGKLSPVPPTAGAIAGAAAGVTWGVFGSGRWLGASGTIGEAALGTLAGAAFTGAVWGITAALARPSKHPSWLQQAFVLLTASAPVVGAIVAFESRRLDAP